MRTTISLDDDVAAAVEKMRRENGIGISEAVNSLIRAGLSTPPRRSMYEHRTSDLGFRVDISNIGEVLELLDER